MTGYGRSSCEMTDKFVTVEIKSLNSKQLDLDLVATRALHHDRQQIKEERPIVGRVEHGEMPARACL